MTRPTPAAHAPRRGARLPPRVTDAAAELGVSDVTIRGDLSGARAARGGRAGARWGDAGRRPSGSQSLEADARPGCRGEGRRSAGPPRRLVSSPGQAIYVDAGSTAMALADALVERHDLHDLVVVTSGLTIALALEAAVPAVHGDRHRGNGAPAAALPRESVRGADDRLAAARHRVHRLQRHPPRSTGSPTSTCPTRRSRGSRWGHRDVMHAASPTPRSSGARTWR
jgi:hypothetical protein